MIDIENAEYMTGSEGNNDYLVIAKRDNIKVGIKNLSSLKLGQVTSASTMMRVRIAFDGPAIGDIGKLAKDLFPLIPEGKASDERYSYIVGWSGMVSYQTFPVISPEDLLSWYNDQDFEFENILTPFEGYLTYEKEDITATFLKNTFDILESHSKLYQKSLTTEVKPPKGALDKHKIIQSPGKNSNVTALKPVKKEEVSAEPKIVSVEEIDDTVVMTVDTASGDDKTVVQEMMTILTDKLSAAAVEEPVTATLAGANVPEGQFVNQVVTDLAVVLEQANADGSLSDFLKKKMEASTQEIG